MRPRVRIAIGALVAAAFLASPALATFQPVVFYDPPRIVFKDLFDHQSDEDLAVVKNGDRYRFANQGAGTPPTSDSQECDFVAGGVECPVAGIERIFVKLGDLDDEADIDLGSKARQVKQVLRGQEGSDTIDGGPGPQVIKGGAGNDTLRGGAGDDLLNGNGGANTCVGGEGNDVLVNCGA